MSEGGVLMSEGGASMAEDDGRVADDEAIAAELDRRVAALLRDPPPATTDRLTFLRARFDAGLAWVHYPEGLGGLGLPRVWQSRVDAALAAAGAPDNQPRSISIGLGMAAPAILRFGTSEQRRRYLRPLWTGEEVWCQLFSEPEAGSDLAGLGTRAVRRGDDWVVTGQKVWTSNAHNARFGILLARTDPDAPKHAGITFFVCDMTAPGVQVRPIRQLTGQAEFNEVFLTEVVIPDANRIGPLHGGWEVAQTTLRNERVAIGSTLRREEGPIGIVAELWRRNPALRRPTTYARLVQLWVETEAHRVFSLRLRQQLATGYPGPEGSAAKLGSARLRQEISSLEFDLLGDEALRYDTWEMTQPDNPDGVGRGVGYRYLRAKGNSIEGGTSEIMRTIIAERVLGLPREPRTDLSVPWKELRS